MSCIEIALKNIFRKPLEQSNDLLAAVQNEVELDAKQVTLLAAALFS